MWTETLLGIIIVQGIGIIGGLIGIYVRFNNKMTRIETKVEGLENRRSEQREDHDKLRVQVQGISRRVAQHEAIIRAAK